MSKPAKKLNASLLNREASGGDIAEGGTIFQANVVISAVCRWLAEEGFSQLTRESLGDVEAKFFVPGQAFQLEFIEAKNHTLDKTEFWREIDRFLELDAAHPGNYRHFTLASPDVAANLKSMVNGLARVRKPFDFYGSDSSIITDSYQDFEELVKKQERTEKDAKFLFDKVSIIFDLGGQSQSNHLFEAIRKYLPDYMNLSVRELEAIYINLKEFLHSRKNQPFTRIEIEEKFREKIEERHLPSPRPIILCVTNSNQQGSGGVRFNWAAFGGESVPTIAMWQEKVFSELEQTREWILQARTERRIKIVGMNRLPIAFTIGAIFSATQGFELEISHRDNTFSTANRVYDGNALYPYKWQIACSGDLSKAERLIVTVGIVASLARDVENYVRQTNDMSHPMLHFYGTEPLASAQQAEQAVSDAKRVLREYLSGTKITQIDLFLAGPSWFASFLGYRSSSLPTIQTYQFLASTRQYSPALLISAR